MQYGYLCIRAVGCKSDSKTLPNSADLPEECLLALSDEIPILMQFLYTAYMNMEVWFDVVDSDSVIRAYKWYRWVKWQ